MVNPAFAEALRSARLLAIVRGDDRDRLISVTQALYASGIRLVEISLNGRGALEAIAELSAGLPAGCWLGAGTVRSRDDLSAALDAGAGFVVSPAVTDVVAAAAQNGVPVLAGALTPTEIETALARGATAVKLFPASLGGVPYLQALRQPYPQVPFVPVGGVGVHHANTYLQAGAIAVGVGAPLLGDAATSGNPAQLAERVRQFLDAVAA